MTEKLSPYQGFGCLLLLISLIFINVGGFALGLFIAPSLIPGVTIADWPTRLIVAIALALSALAIASVMGIWGLKTTFNTMQQDPDRFLDGRSSSSGASFWLYLKMKPLTFGTFALVLAGCDFLGTQVQFLTGMTLVLTTVFVLLTSDFVGLFFACLPTWLGLSWWRGLVYTLGQLCLLSCVPAALWLISRVFPNILQIDSSSALFLGFSIVYILRNQLLMQEDILFNRDQLKPEKFQAIKRRSYWLAWIVVIWHLFLPFGFFPGICALASYWVDGFTITGYFSALGVAIVIMLAGFPEYRWSKYIKNELNRFMERKQDSIY
ncbi:MAG: hypothetical protein J7647_09070 [Cyanobacteria bacterium SBLK]|nr:hypothetical protein [Cyanobacteria bacterium SBLK]